MPADRIAPTRCAIYTRKSSEEGLEQSFNSLDAQREACTAYIASQRHEGWKLVGTHYDDGGYSGGTLERPALTRLLADIDSGRIDTVVVYKVDRLTRSLADFAKIVEAFDAKGISFVSVTQQFNTTTSMGRLTLNVLLSFAQFEREVTGERIRDKIAASKKKGMWMGGMVPLGYDVKDRKLTTNVVEAELVGRIYRSYLDLGCVAKLKAELDTQDARSKVRVSAKGIKTGGHPFSRGALYMILQNRIYRGEIAHKGQSYPGEHESVVAQDLWEAVQARLKGNCQARRNGTKARESSLLAGIIYDGNGNRLTPSHAVKNGKRYRYYVSQAVIRNGSRKGKRADRIPAHEIEHLIARRLQSFLGSGEAVLDGIAFPSDDATFTRALVAAAKLRSTSLTTSAPAEAREFLLEAVSRVVVNEKSVEILVRKQGLRAALFGDTTTPMALPSSNPRRAPRAEDDVLRLTIEACVKRCGGEVRMVVPAGTIEHEPARLVPSLIKAVARAHDWYSRMITGETRYQSVIAEETGFDERYVSRIMKCAFLAPDIVEAILAGRQPPDLTLEKVLYRLPSDWTEQRQLFGFPAIPSR